MCNHKGDLPGVTNIVKNGINNNSRNWAGRTALMESVLMGHDQIADFLLQKGADPNIKANNKVTALYFAVNNAFKQDFLLTKLLLNYGANVNQKALGLAPLISAAGGGRFEIVKLLLKYKADINIRDKSKNTALTKAAYPRAALLTVVIKKIVQR